MATRKKTSFKSWATSHSLHNPKTKLPWRWSIRVHEDMADFTHGMAIGLLLGFIIGLITLKILV
jgi:hypothetical protein